MDGNHSAVMQALRDAAMKPYSTAMVGDGFPDAFVSFRGIWVALEIKDGEKSPSARKLTAAEEKFAAECSGPLVLVTSPEEAVMAVIEQAKKLGRI